jgi:uracil-DNA glycosylase family 4
MCPLRALLPDTCQPLVGVGQPSPLMIVGDAPSENEILTQTTFYDSSLYLEKMLESTGLDIGQCYITNLMKCKPKRAAKKDEIDSCKKWLWKEIKKTKPRVIVTMGKISSISLLKGQIKQNFTMKDLISREFSVSYCDAKILPCYGPLYLLNQGKQLNDQARMVLKYAAFLSGIRTQI